MMLNVKNMTVKYGSLTIVDNITFHAKKNRWLMIVGPNGAGKSTIVNAISGGTPYLGSIELFDKDVRLYKPHELARNIGILTQNHYVGYSFSVREVIKLGRYSHTKGIFSSKNSSDESAVDMALELTGLMPLANQSVLTLSGGELQRTFLAQLFAQDPKLLILDEPTNHLDLVYQKELFALVKNWLTEKGRAVISVVHDLSLAKAFGDDAFLMNKGKILAFGTSADVLTREKLSEAYSMDVYEWMRSMLEQWS